MIRPDSDRARPRSPRPQTAPHGILPAGPAAARPPAAASRGMFGSCPGRANRARDPAGTCSAVPSASESRTLASLKFTHY
jgi:hypothetical protein